MAGHEENDCPQLIKKIYHLQSTDIFSLVALSYILRVQKEGKRSHAPVKSQSR